MESFIKINNPVTNDSIISSRIDNLSRIDNAADSSQLSKQDKAGYAQAARGFESIFVYMLLKQMRESMLEETDNEMTFGADTLQGYTDLMFSDYAAKSGTGIGIANLIYKNFTGENLKPITQDNQSNVQIGTNNIGHNAELSNSSSMAATSNNFFEQIHNKIESTIKQIENQNRTAISESFIDRLNSRFESYSDIIEDASNKYGVPANLIKAIITAESAGRADAVSPAGAKGLMQLMDGTARNLGVRNSFNPEENIMGGTCYIRQMLDWFDNLELALAAYNAGPGNVQKYYGVPPFKETKAYIQRVLGYYERFNRENV